MNSGKLRHRITIQSKGVARDSFGAEVITWLTEKTVWASVDPIFGREYFLAHQVQADVTHSIRIRYYEGLRPDWRILFGSRIFDIKSIINLEERGREMVLMARENVT